MAINGHIQQRIILDVAGKLSVEDSMLEYDDEMLEYRDEIEEQQDKTGRTPYVPAELPDDPESAYDGKLKERYLSGKERF